MDKSGSRQSRYLRTPARKMHRRTSVYLTEQQKYEVACDLMNDMGPRNISHKWGISESQVSHIKYEFLEVVVVWKPGILDKFKGSPEKAQESFKSAPLVPYAGKK